MNHSDVVIKLSFMTCLTIMYCATFLTQKFDLATISTPITVSLGQTPTIGYVFRVTT